MEWKQLKEKQVWTDGISAIYILEIKQESLSCYFASKNEVFHTYFELSKNDAASLFWDMDKLGEYILISKIFKSKNVWK